MTFLKNFNKRQKLVTAAILLFFIVIIFYSISTILYRNGKVKTTFIFAPYSATITLNNTRISNNTTSWIEPGNYHLKVSSNEHLEAVEKDIIISEESHEFYDTLSPLDDEGREFTKQHREEYANVEGIIGNYLNRQGQKQKQKFPILSYLPINNSLYSISYEYDDNNMPIINIKSDPKYLDVAVARLKNFKNIDLTELNINFLLNNPFTDKKTSSSTNPKTFIKECLNVKDPYKISDGQDYNDYYYTTIYTDDYWNDQKYAYYRVLLKKQGETWELISSPQPLLTSKNTPNIEKDLLNLVNSY